MTIIITASLNTVAQLHLHYARCHHQVPGPQITRQEEPDILLQSLADMQLEKPGKDKQIAPKLLYRIYDDKSRDRLTETGFTAPRTLGNVSNDEKWAHLTITGPTRHLHDKHERIK
jgi:hypothetical protein